MSTKEPREHGLLFGRGDDLPEGVEEPPFGHIPVVPLYGPTPVPFGEPPSEPVTIEGEIPWELQDESGR